MKSSRVFSPAISYCTNFAILMNSTLEKKISKQIIFQNIYFTVQAKNKTNVYVHFSAFNQGLSKIWEIITQFMRSIFTNTKNKFNMYTFKNNFDLGLIAVSHNFVILCKYILLMQHQHFKKAFKAYAYKSSLIVFSESFLIFL